MLPRLLSFLLFSFAISLIPGNLSGQDLVINEFMSDNDLTIEDGLGEFTDWLELHNRGTGPLDLGSYFLSDDSAQLLKWRLPDLDIVPGGFQLVFASDADTVFEGDPGEWYLHANFKIASSGEELYLSDSSGNPVDSSISINLRGDQSYGRVLDGSESWKVFHLPSPGYSNNLGNALYFSRDRGFQATPFYLKINSEREMEIRYTLDGSTPTPASLLFPDSLYIGSRDNDPNGISLIPTTQPPPVDVIKSWEPPLHIIQKATVIRCRSFFAGEATSPVYSATYWVDPNGNSRYTQPVFSFMTDSLNLFDYDTGLFVPGVHADPANNRTGNYFERGIEWERPVHIEYFDTEGDAQIVQDGGIRIHGQYSRRAAQKSLRLYARNEYGKKYFSYPFLQDKSVKEYKRLILRSSMTTFDSRFGDAFIADRLKDLDYELQDYQPAIVFVNGEYWGVHNIREYLDKHFLHSHYPEVDEDSINLLRFNGQVMEGNNQTYWELINFVRDHPLSDPGNFAHVLGKIDYSNYLDYCVTEIYLANRDWPGNNVIYWQSQKGPSPWRWILNDLDASFRFPDLDMFQQAMDSTRNKWPNPEWSTFLFRNMATNEQFKGDFVKRAMKLLDEEFNPVSMEEAIGTYKQQFLPEMEEHILRWNFPESDTAWINYYDSTMVRFANTRPVYFLDQMAQAFNLSDEEICALCECCDASVPLEILIHKPDSGQVFDAPLDLKVLVEAEYGGAPVRMSLLLNDLYIGTEDAAAFQWEPGNSPELAGLPEGDYTASIMAYDARGITSSIAETEFVVVEMSPGSEVLLGNLTDSLDTQDVWTSNMVINKSDIYTNRTQKKLYLKTDHFSFFAASEADPVTPFIVRIDSTDHFTVLSVGDTRTADQYNPGSNSFSFRERQDTILTLVPGETIATGFLDAYADGSGGGAGPVVTYDLTEPADQVWYSGNSNWYRSGSVFEGSSPIWESPPRTYYLRNYHFQIGFTLMESDHLPTYNLLSDPISGFRIYPNPVEGDYVHVALGGASGPVRLTLFDLQGRTMFTEICHGDHFQFPSSILSIAGTYLIKAETSSGVRYGKLIRL